MDHINVIEPGVCMLQAASHHSHKNKEQHHICVLLHTSSNLALPFHLLQNSQKFKNNHRMRFLGCPNDDGGEMVMSGHNGNQCKRKLGIFTEHFF